MKAALLYILGDGLQSLGVIIAGIIIFFKPAYVAADPVCTLVFSVLVFSTTFPIVKDCFGILMEESPNDVDIVEMSQSINKVRFI